MIPRALPLSLAISPRLAVCDGLCLCTVWRHFFAGFSSRVELSGGCFSHYLCEFLPGAVEFTLCHFSRFCDISVTFPSSGRYSINYACQFVVSREMEELDVRDRLSDEAVFNLPFSADPHGLIRTPGKLLVLDHEDEYALALRSIEEASNRMSKVGMDIDGGAEGSGGYEVDRSPDSSEKKTNNARTDPRLSPEPSYSPSHHRQSSPRSKPETSKDEDELVYLDATEEADKKDLMEDERETYSDDREFIASSSDEEAEEAEDAMDVVKEVFGVKEDDLASLSSSDESPLPPTNKKAKLPDGRPSSTSDKPPQTSKDIITKTGATKRKATENSTERKKPIAAPKVGGTSAGGQAQRKIQEDLEYPLSSLKYPLSDISRKIGTEIVSKYCPGCREEDGWPTQKVVMAIVHFLSLAFFKLALAIPTESYRRLLEQSTTNMLYDDWLKNEWPKLTSIDANDKIWNKHRHDAIGVERLPFLDSVFAVSFESVASVDRDYVCALSRETIPKGGNAYDITVSLRNGKGLSFIVRRKETLLRFIQLVMFSNFKEVCICRTHGFVKSRAFGRSTTDLKKAEVWRKTATPFIIDVVEEYFILSSAVLSKDLFSYAG